MSAPTIARDHRVRIERRITGLCRGEGPSQLGLEPVELLGFGSLLVAADQVADIFADILIGTLVAYIGSDEIAQCAADADIEGHGLVHVSQYSGRMWTSKPLRTRRGELSISRSP